MALHELYRHSLALLTDLYQLTMAYGYWKNQLSEREAVFHLTFRQNPFGGEFSIACGLAAVLELVQNFRFEAEDLEYLGLLEGANGKRLFEAEFLQYLSQLRFSGDLDAVVEGTVVFPHEPLVRMRGPLLQCQLFETALLNLVNFQTLIATKSARICLAAGSDQVLEFGLRRAQGIDGGLSASRAAFVGGCHATSNVLAGKLYGIPVRGTHAHSWVMTFDDEVEAFRRYAAAIPNNCLFLVDTYDTVRGVERAVEIGRELRSHGHEMLGVRLDSGDLTALSIQARRILDEGGFPDASIVASNDLDEHEITQLRQHGAQINVWGVGTRLATAHDQPALGGVYKLSAIETPSGWEDRIKLSEQAIKVSNPGILQVRRYQTADRLQADIIFDERHGAPEGMVDLRGERRDAATCDGDYEDLLVPIFRRGDVVYDPPALPEARQRAQQQLARLSPETRRLNEPQAFWVGLETGLYQHKQEMIRSARRSPR